MNTVRLSFLAAKIEADPDNTVIKYILAHKGGCGLSTSNCDICPFYHAYRHFECYGCNEFVAIMYEIDVDSMDLDFFIKAIKDAKDYTFVKAMEQSMKGIAIHEKENHT